jgi:hypothetical protein
MTFPANKLAVADGSAVDYSRLAPCGSTIVPSIQDPKMEFLVNIKAADLERGDFRTRRDDPYISAVVNNSIIWCSYKARLSS